MTFESMSQKAPRRRGPASPVAAASPSPRKITGASSPFLGVAGEKGMATTERETFSGDVISARERPSSQSPGMGNSSVQTRSVAASRKRPANQSIDLSQAAPPVSRPPMRSHRSSRSDATGVAASILAASCPPESGEPVAPADAVSSDASRQAARRKPAAGRGSRPGTRAGLTGRAGRGR